VPKGSRVAINGLTCYAVPQAVKAADCVPVYVDINAQDFNFDIEELGKILTSDPKIKAVIIQNHLGLAVDIKAIEKLAKKHDLTIIEDLAHCAGSHYADGREVGTVGDATALSFGKSKAIDTTEGGALVLRVAPSFALEEDMEDGRARERASSEVIVGATSRQVLPALADRLRDRIYPITGWKVRQAFRIGLGKAVVAFVFKTRLVTRSAEGRVNPRLRLTHWQAKLALEQFKNLNQTAKTRAKYAAQYSYPKTSSILRIPFLVNNRNRLLKQLQKHNIFLDDSWYDVPVSPKRYYARSNFPETSCPVATRVAGQMLNLPLLPEEKLKTALDLIRPEVVK
jgi:dTDP-4-amino-4,6-dideoxygalactose transaminase